MKSKITMTALTDYKEDIKSLFYKGFHLARVINGNVFIRLSDSSGSVWSYSSCDVFWDLYFNDGVKVTAQERRCDENTKFIQQQIIVNSEDQTCQEEVSTYTSTAQSETNLQGKQKPNHKTSRWKLRSNTRKRNLENSDINIELETSASESKQNKIECNSSQYDLICDEDGSKLNKNETNISELNKNETNIVKVKTVKKEGKKKAKQDKRKTKSLKVKYVNSNNKISVNDNFNVVKEPGKNESSKESMSNKNESETSKESMSDKNEIETSKASMSDKNEIETSKESMSDKNEIETSKASMSDTDERTLMIETTADESYEITENMKTANVEENNCISDVDACGEVNTDEVFTCRKCSQTFATQVTLDLHIKSIICDRFKCQECGLLFATKDGILEHKFAKHKKELFQCSICAKTFSTKAHLRCHNNVHIGRYMCSKCKKYFPEKRNMTQHRCKALKSGQGSFKPLICEECKCTFSMKEEMLIHDSLYHNEKNDCPRCKVNFTNRASLMDHLKICKVKLPELQNENFRKPVKERNSKTKQTKTNSQKNRNDKSSTSKSNNHHLIVNNSSSTPHLLYDQNLTIDETSSPTLLSSNENSTYVNSAFDVDNDKKCSWCKRQFSDSGELLKHVMSCEVFFSEEVALSKKPTEEDLQSHIFGTGNQLEMAAPAGVDHGNPGEFVEDYISQVDPNDPTTLNLKQLYTCVYCDVCFYTKTELQEHNNKLHTSIEQQQSEADIPQHQCPVCEMTFNSLDDLNGHKLTHMQELLQCNLCGKSFTTKGLLRLHNNIHIKSYMCAICKVYFKEKSRLLNHVCSFYEEERSEIQAINCDSCKIGLSDELELQCHNSIHHCEVFKCCKCSRQFNEQKHLMEHFKICKSVNEKQDNKCCICGAVFACKWLLDSHLVSHTGNFRCNVCYRIFSFEKALEKHTENCCLSENTVNDRDIYCEICNYYFKFEVNLIKHNQIHHQINEENEIQEQEPSKNRAFKVKEMVISKPESVNQIDFQCDLCGRNFSSKAYLKCHNNIHIGRYQCENCKRCFSETRHLNTHYSRCGVNDNECDNYKPIYCCSCKIYFPTDVDLNHHNRFFHNDEIYRDYRYNCSHCEVVLGNKDRLLEHLKTCNYRTGKKTNLKEVLGEELHTKIIHKKLRKKIKTRKFNITEVEICNNKRELSKVQCPTCFKYYKVSYIECHMRTHTNERPYKCAQCPKSFKFKNHIMNHAITHMKDRPYVCEICGKSFPHPLYLKFHKNMHIRPCKCDICGKTFMTNPQVNRHKLTEHEGRKQHQCDLCGKCYSRSPALVKHKLAHHKNY